MSHELRTPLSGILGMNELLLTSGLTRQQLEYATTLHTCATDLLKLITDLIDISEIEIGGISLKESAFNPHSIVSTIAEKIEPAGESQESESDNRG